MDVLLKDFPLCPSLRLTGPHLLLFWWDSYYHGKVIVAKTRKQIEEVWRIRLRSEPDARVVRLWDSVIVSPPLEVSEEFARESYKSERGNFAWWLKSLSDEYVEINKKLPPGATRCLDYKYEYSNGEDDDEKEESDKGHSSCANCAYGIAFPFDVLYEKFSTEFHAHPTSYKPRAVLTNSPIVPHNPELPVYVACHLDSEKPWRLVTDSYSGSHPDFFFQGVELDSSDLEKAAKKAYAIEKRAHTKREKVREKEFQKSKIDDAARIERMLRSI